MVNQTAERNTSEMNNTHSVIYSTKNGDQLKILVNQLVNSSQFNTTIDLQNSTYFSKNYQPVEKTLIVDERNPSIDK